MQTQIEKEERLNTLTHAVGVLLAVIGLVILLVYNSGKPWGVFSIGLYAFSAIFLFTSSTLYHAAVEEQKKAKLRILDHISIYFMIAGTYTPVVLLLLQHGKGWLLFWLVWGIALFGLFLKLFFTGKFSVFSTLLYLVMGWLILLDFETLTTAIHPNGLNLLKAGGILYSVGIIFYVVEKIPYNHVIWHLFVLGGAICHYFMVLWYVV